MIKLTFWIVPVLLLISGCSKPSSTSSGPSGQLSSTGTEMEKLSGGPNWNMESVGSNNNAWTAKSFDIPSQGRLVIVGWAIDSRKKTAAGGVNIDIDGTSYPAQYGNPRPDVAAAIGSPDCTNSGYKLDIAANQFAPGVHTMLIRVLTSNQKAYWEMGPYSLNFK